MECGQRFHVSWNDIGYSFEPDPKKNNLPEVKEILWKRCRMGFGGRGCGLDTEVRLVPGSSEADKKAYQKILTPTEVDEGRWMPYPDYTYVPMLMTAFNIRYAWGQQQKIATIVAQADQNLKDALALRKATYDLRQYE